MKELLAQVNELEQIIQTQQELILYLLQDIEGIRVELDKRPIIHSGSEYNKVSL
ncbi:hypothetical protein [Xanthocytophaga flava]|uniref:hypothetical protein n=1 Tax=Xanthocytophaga flava TaxID=3048013 RepID=UPI0028D172AE|nr:hypothetical protein [Xanthocytophaga flavus]MDJ1470182.1 hypothetical protein [Xanthocytophaga flavus]